MREDETLGELLAALKAQNADTLRIFAESDLDTPVPVPRDAPWFPPTSTTGRSAGSPTT